MSEFCEHCDNGLPLSGNVHHDSHKNTFWCKATPKVTDQTRAVRSNLRPFLGLAIATVEMIFPSFDLLTGPEQFVLIGKVETLFNEKIPLLTGGQS